MKITGTTLKTMFNGKKDFLILAIIFCSSLYFSWVVLHPVLFPERTETDIKEDAQELIQNFSQVNE